MAEPSTLSSSSIYSDDRTLDNTGYCLLSLDGGGVRGLSTLYILQSIMNRLNDVRKEAGLQPKKPCDIFDLIGGTSTGGLIAIMLGRLEMTVGECIAAYTKLMKQVFEKKEHRSIVGILGGVKSRFSSETLKNAIAQVIKERNIDIDEKLDNGTVPKCKVFVCTKFQKTSAITRLRNYRRVGGLERHPTILEAALATSAAPTYFSDVAIEGNKFVDGAMGANNPALEVEDEARFLWCEETANLKPLVKCFISIGTGHPGVRSVSDRGLKHLAETLRKEATETERTTEYFLSSWREHLDNNRCFRFDVGHGLEHVKLAEYQEEDLIKAATWTYLEGSYTTGKVRKCIENLRLKKYEPTANFNKMLRAQTQVQVSERSDTLPRAGPIPTASEILELTTTGTAHLRASYTCNTVENLKEARHCFTKALHYLRNDPSTSPRQVSLVCQKLVDTSIMLSMNTRDQTLKKQHADLAREYGEAALDNEVRLGDECAVAQVQFMLSYVSVWKVCLQARSSGMEPRSHPERYEAEARLQEMLRELRRFPNLDMEAYEKQAQKYMGYLYRE